jgi:ABC-type oligopeptide transport system substrate-binding subunit
MEAYATEHATTEENPADANPGGFSSELVDALIAEGRVASTQSARAEVYARLDAALDAAVPAWPVWFETAVAGISDQVIAGGVPVDPTQPRYDWDIASWSLRPS